MMENMSNGVTTDGSVIVTKTEMDQPVSDDQQLVEESTQQDGEYDLARGPPAAEGVQPPAQKLGLGFGKKGCGRPTGGLAVLISATLIFSLAVTVALIIQIYVGPYEVGQYGGVAADVPQCSEIGGSILQKGGSAVDAAIAALFCVSVINAHNSGIGGGGFMLVHDHKTNMTHSIDFRETAPLSASSNMYSNKHMEAKTGSRSVGVPGYLKGLDTAYQLYGRLPWRELVTPSIDIARDGFNVTEEIVLSLGKVSVDQFHGPLRKIYVRNGQFVSLGDKIIQPELAETLSIIAEKGPMALYEGELAESIVNATKGHITLQDLQEYKVSNREAVESSYKDKTVLSMPAPGGGPTLLMILNIIEGFNWTSVDRNNSVAYRNMLETFRFAYAQRTLLGDPDFNPRVHNSSAYMIRKDFAASIRNKILSYNKTKPVGYYQPASYLKPSKGTTHVSASDSRELYVSVTASTNSLFGAQLMTSTGIQLNNHMADFDIPTETNNFDLASNPLNYPEPGKRPLSAMTPTIMFTTKKPCALRMAIGASNATRIITGVAETIVNMLSFGMTLKEAVDHPRVHDGLFESETDYEKGLPDKVVSYLQSQGYNLTEITEGLSSVQAVMVTNDTTSAASDKRKGGKAVALNNE